MSDFNVAERHGKEMSISTNENPFPPSPDGVKSGSPVVQARAGTKRFMGKAGLPGKAARKQRREINVSQHDAEAQSPLRDSLDASPGRTRARRNGGGTNAN